MKIVETSIPEVVIIEPEAFQDPRGYFMESFRENLFNQKPFNTHFVQDNESYSTYGVLRGLHYQLPPFAQSKLVRVVQGAALDVAIDIRVGSPTFGQHVSTLLSHQNRLMMFIPRGFAHGFVVLSEECLFQYKCDNYYSPQHEASIIWNDPTLNIDWRVPSPHIVLNERDKKHPTLHNARLFDYNINLYENGKQ